MTRLKSIVLVIFAILTVANCGCVNAKVRKDHKTKLPALTKPVVVGAERVSEYLPILQGKRIALLSNQTGVVGPLHNKHTLDLLLEKGLNVTTIFSPEHGFRGKADAGEHVKSSVDEKTGIPIASLYEGKSRMPSKETMDRFDVIVTDIQDVGLRFYTYYITMVNMMDAAAAYDKEFVVFDRPNPNGMTVDGPILDMNLKSGVGWLPIPTVHGMTMGEIAQMTNGEGWLKDGKKIKLTVIPCKNYTHQTRYKLPVAPSPNLPNMLSIYLYPSTCYFEGTPVSLGRGTKWPFQVYGHPNMKGYKFSFTPTSLPGAKNPAEDVIAKGMNLEYVIDAYRNLNMGDKFFTSFFDKLAGRTYIREMIQAGKSADEIREMWQKDVEKFKEQRRPYLLYSE